MATASDENIRLARKEALAWFVRVNSGDASDREHLDFAMWMASSKLNRFEYEKLSQVWSDLERIALPRASRPSVAPRQLSRRTFLVAGATALGAASYVAVAGLPSFITSDFATGTGELQTLVLPDSSTVHLDAGTAIAIDFNEQTRDIRLQRGRAYFDVKQDVSRPFRVAAAGGVVTALGTRFVTHQWGDAVTVTVEENAVSVHAPDQKTTVVDAGQDVSYDKAGLGEVRAADLESEFAWRRGKLIFEDRPLSQVLADVNRYRSGTIRVTDGRLLEMRVSGIFDITNPDGVLDAIRSTLPVRTVELTRYLVLLRPA